MNENKIAPVISQMKKGGKLWVIVALLGVGAALLFLGNSDTFRAAREADESCVHEEKLNIDDYELALEDDIEGFCKRFYGVESSAVSVRLAGSTQSIYATDSQTGSAADRDEYVIIGSGSNAHPIYLGERSPEILGIGIILTGRNILISKNEAEALISAAYGVPLSRIYIKILDMG